MMNPPREDMSRLANLDDFIAYCESTPEESWTCDVVRTKTNQNCLFGHLVDWFYGPEYTGVISGAWDYFEEMWASTFMVYPINDGTNPKYPQASPKARSIAFLKDMAEGRVETSAQYWDRMDKEMEP